MKRLLYVAILILFSMNPFPVYSQNEFLLVGSKDIITDLVWSPRGDYIYYTYYSASKKNENVPQLILCDAATASTHTITIGEVFNAPIPKWSPDGTEIAFGYGLRQTGGLIRVYNVDQHKFVRELYIEEIESGTVTSDKWMIQTGLMVPGFMWYYTPDMKYRIPHNRPQEKIKNVFTGQLCPPTAGIERLSPDGRYYYESDRGALFVGQMGDFTRIAELTAGLDRKKVGVYIGGREFSKDSKKFAFVLSNEYTGHDPKFLHGERIYNTFFIYDIPGNKRKVILQGERYMIHKFDFDPTGKHIVAYIEDKELKKKGLYIINLE